MNNLSSENMFNELIALNASSNLMLNDILQNNYLIQQTSFTTADFNSHVHETANNISPEKITSETESSTETSSSSDIENQPVSSTPRGKKIKKTHRRKLNCEFIKDCKQRASTKYRRRAGIIRKIKSYDTLTGSQSLFISICNKGFINSFANDGKEIQSLMPKIEDIIGAKKNMKNSYTNCKLIDEGKHISTASQRILNSNAKDKIIFAKKGMSGSISIDFNVNSSCNESNNESVIDLKTFKTKKRLKKKQKENKKPLKVK